jgi:RNA ligase
MDYKFPVINSFDDVKDKIAGRPEFIVVEKEGYKVVNYVYQGNDTFPKGDVHLPECRGLIFCSKTGKVLRRAYHKFFNDGEKEHSYAKFNTKPHAILEKLDGSMVTPIMLNGALRLTTKMGITSTSMEAEVFLARNPNVKNLMLDLMKDNYTPIFEWLDKDSPIVIRHPKDSLVLTAIRHNTTGEYWPYNAMLLKAMDYEVPFVRRSKINKSAEETEGVVIRFDDGHMIKVKTDWYVALHRVKEDTDNPRKVIKLICEDKLDDLKPVLIEPIKSRVLEIEREFIEGMFTRSEYLIEAFPIRNHQYSHDRKAFALEFVLNPAYRWDKFSKQILFRMYDAVVDGKTPLVNTMIKDLVAKHCNSDKDFEQLNKEFLKCQF